VLDAACGTGQHAIALAQAGYQVAGADLFPQMVQMADLNASAADQKIYFKAAGFGSISTAFAEEQFQAVLCLGNSLPHVKSSTELQATLLDFAKLLAPGGLALIQQRNFDQIMYSKERQMPPQSHQKGDEEWLFFRFYDFEPSGLIQFNILTLHRKKDQKWQVELNTTTLMPILSEELTKALENAGFGDIQRFGNLKGEAFDPLTSGDLIVLAKRI
jgi:SAM-dependent methyltransferase